MSVETIRLELRPPRLLSQRLNSMLMGILLTSVIVVIIGAGSPETVGALYFAGLLGGLGVLLVVRRLLARPRSVPPIEIAEAHLVLPIEADSARTARVGFEELLGLSVRLLGREPILVVETAQRAFLFPASSFVAANAIELFAAALRERLLAHPSGSSILARMSLREDAVREAMSARPVLTYALMASIAAGFLAQILTGALDDPLALLRMGANAPTLVAAGDWWRLCTANFLHGGHLHLYLNGLAIYTLGAVLEKMVGPWRVLVVYLVASVGGALVSVMVARAPWSVGASTAVFGLFGALALLNFRYRRDLPIGFRQPAHWWAFQLAVNGSLPLFVPQIDGAAHVGGFLAGAAVAFGLSVGEKALRFRAPASTPLKALAVALVLVTSLAFVQLGRDALGGREALQARWEATLDAAGDASPDLLNNVAWAVAIDPEASPRALAAADRMAARAYALRSDAAPVVDTLAAIRFRLGDIDDALVKGAAALELAGGGAEYATHMLRYLEARKAGGAERVPGELASDASRAKVEREGDQRRLVVQLDAAAPEGLVLWGLTTSYGTRSLLRVKLGAASTASPGTVSIEEPADAPWPGSISALDLVWQDARGCACSGNVRDARFWTYDARVDGIPDRR